MMPLLVRFAQLPCLVLILTVVLTAQTRGQESVDRWTRWEGRFSSGQSPEPTSELTMLVKLTRPEGSTLVVPGFWAGETIWKVRWLASEVGQWAYEVIEAPAEDLVGQAGTFTCRETSSNQPLLRHGAIQVSRNRRHLEHADGTPFFWLADTAWNGALLASEDDWQTYLKQRRGLGFTAIQLVTTQWRAADGNRRGEQAYTGRDPIAINPTFFEDLDGQIDAVNQAGLLAAPVVLWALGDASVTPGKLPVDQASRLARYIVARYQGNHVLWFLGGDEGYGDRIDFWTTVGQRTFGDIAHAPVTLHPRGMQWEFAELEDQDWIDLWIYQSGHGDDAKTLRWLHSGPPSQVWEEIKPRPILNSEPPYEGHIAYQSRQPHSASNVRRASYWSLLIIPTAGVSYGSHGVWSWEEQPGVPKGHPNAGIAPPWHEAINRPGALQLEHLQDLFTSLPWWRLRPAPDLLVDQPGQADPTQFIAAASTPEVDLVVLYLPQQARLAKLRPNTLDDDLSYSWFNPRTGERQQAQSKARGQFTTPDDQDWVLIGQMPK